MAKLSPALELIQAIRRLNPVSQDRELLAWIQDVEERLQEFERVLANDVGPAVRKAESMPDVDYNPPFRLK